ncbi:cyclin-D-binding Myb-like transcription factor 1 isoform X2 [Branchiostoma floridae]|uniref:Cyclin-D-binding Myb-like transcription factor 1 isoform X2 n=1 Tax=Branchiostoma floridae TaxID=7739 RepID=A0A9J7MZG6_BRAFL|nr:cyclin-D-binding Myb-like transcription factor 1 isoform X2 [Branchiostoma floridae]
MESFCEIHGVEEPRTLLYPNQYEERKALKKLIHEAGLFRHLAQGLDRPLWNVYTRARYMYSNAEVTGKWTPKEHKKLMQLYEQHGPRWALISKSLGRFEDNIKQRFRHTRRKSMGRWSAKESRLLIQAVQAVTGKQDVTNVTSGISWQACSDFMNNVRNGRQCHNHW